MRGTLSSSFSDKVINSYLAFVSWCLCGYLNSYNKITYSNLRHSCVSLARSPDLSGSLELPDPPASPERPPMAGRDRRTNLYVP